MNAESHNFYFGLGLDLNAIQTRNRFYISQKKKKI
jgi:hypothetical protein